MLCSVQDRQKDFTMRLLLRRQAFLLFMCLISFDLLAQDFQTGDIIFHTSKSAQSIVIQKATHSPYSHMGMIVHKNHKIWVLEAIQPVKYTPLQQWINRGTGARYVLKRYTEDGNWDLVGNNTPVFFIKDAKKFPDFIHTQKRIPKTNLKSATMKWDFWSFNPESLHQVLILMSDRGTPYGYRHMHGFGSHTFSMINNDHERVWVKFHFKSKQGIKNFTAEDAQKMSGENPDFAQEDLVNAIENNEFPKWTLFIQVMTEEQAQEFRWNPFDVTKVWFQDEFPLLEVGEMELNEIPDNFFAHVEQATFSPSNLISGISFSPDKMLQGRLFSYPDAHRYRVGVNSHLLEVNRCPFSVNNYKRDGAMANSSNYKDAPNYYPNSFDEIKADSDYKNLEYDLDSTRVAHFNRNENDDDHYTQPGLLYTKAMNQEDRAHLIKNIVDSMNDISGPKREEIINRQLCHFFRANIELGMKIAIGLQVNIDANMMTHTKSHE